ncbi:11420_t:CDS:10 [Rhizophagus irregularis]|nr:11420_t:CDS:10 [Rhizophagus irregularis]
MPENYSQDEPITRRLHGILKDYPDGSQILREILQNSDDAKSTEQIFILDHNTYPSNRLIKPNSVNYERANLRLGRYQGPALLAKNNTIFEKRDFESLRNLSNSKKKDQIDKIGVMGLGFNSIYHITDFPSFITGDKYANFDPHKWHFLGGIIYNFVDEKLFEESPDQLAPFKIPCDETCDNPFKKPFKGTVFRYPLRDYTESEISNKIYKPKEILDMFHNFYEKESINCLLFLKYIERIYFYELKKGATELELLYTIQLENADQVRQQRRLIAENIVPMMKLLKSKELSSKNQLETSSYVALFSRQKKRDTKKIYSWLILNYLDDLFETEAHCQKKFDIDISNHKLIPNIGLAVPLNNLNVTGRLFCFLPLPIEMPFPVSVHGYFAVKSDRRSLWLPAENEGLALRGSANLNIEWNLYLFEKVLPKAWAKFLRELPFKVPNIRSNDTYKFWPIIKDGISGNLSRFCKGLLQNVIECLNVEDRVFRGPSSSNTIGEISEASVDLYNTSSFQKSEFHWLSLHNGYLEDENVQICNLSSIIKSIGFPFISTLQIIVSCLKNSTKHKDSLHLFTPAIIRNYLRCNSDRWQDGVISREEILSLFEYILKNEKFDELEGFKMIPLADGTLDTLTQSGSSYAYIDSYNKTHKNDECNIFKYQLNKFIDKSITISLYRCLYENAKANWILNIKILDEFAVRDMIEYSLNYKESTKDSEEIPMPDNYEWIYQLWDNLKFRNWDLTKFEDIHLIPTKHFTLRKLKTPTKTFSSKHISNNLISIFEKFGAVFVNSEFDTRKISKWNKVSPYIIKPDKIISVLDSFRANASYPDNLKINLQSSEATELVEHLFNYLRLVNKFNLVQNHIDVIKRFPIFIEVDHNSPIPLLPLQHENKRWYLLPHGEEKLYGKIIYPSDKGGFINSISQNMCYILENIIGIYRLTSNDYWRYYVIPYLKFQRPEDIDIAIDKLFDRLPNFNNELIEVIGNQPFVPAGTIGMFIQQQTPNIINLTKPTELFNPVEMKVTQLFFEDEEVFPVGSYGIRSNSSNKFFRSLQMLWIKKELTSDDIISRINIIVKRINTLEEHDLIRIKALNLLKYIDEKWDQISYNNNALLETIRTNPWIPTFTYERSFISGRKLFSRPIDCFCKKFENLVCYVKPIVEYVPMNMEWNYDPDEKTVLKQLEFCRDNVDQMDQIQPKLKSICMAIYKYMDVAYDSRSQSFDYMKKKLKNQSWILCENIFRSTDKVFIDDLFDGYLPNKNSLIIILPREYYYYKEMFLSMGVQRWSQVKIKDLIQIIKKVVEKDENKVLSIDEINSVIDILICITNKQKINPGERLDGLLVPSTNNILVSLQKIHYDDIEGRLGYEKKHQYLIAHSHVTPQIAKDLKMQSLAGKICDIDHIEDDTWRFYEQDLSLNTKINNITERINFMPYDFIKEFLQIADDAKATHFSVIMDRKQNSYYTKFLLSREMEDLQGPSIWIYFDAQFSNDDIQTLLELKGSCVKDEYDTKIGKFGKGFYYVFHITDLPSIVSGEYITFLDPRARFLPATGYSPKRRRCIRINFIEKEFKKCFPDQCYPYEKMYGCDFTKEFKGTLFRFPLRENLNKINVIRMWKINQEMLFLRNIESCCLYEVNGLSRHQIIWQTKINNIDNCRNSRQTVIDSIDDAQIYQLDIERINGKRKDSEVWVICTGGHDKIKPESSELPRGGVACLLAKSDNKSLDELKSESASNLKVYLNGNFIIPEHDDSCDSYSYGGCCNFISEYDCFWDSYRYGEWNKYILFEVLADLHVKLLEYIMNLEIRNMRESPNFISHVTNVIDNIWPLKSLKSNFYLKIFKNYGLRVISKLGDNRQRKFFWTEANGGQLVSLQDARILEKEQANISNILINLKVPIQIVKLDKEKMEHLNNIVKSKEPRNFPYTRISGKLICKELQSLRPYKPKDNVFNNDNTHDTLFQLLSFILQDKDSFEFLDGLPLIPLNDGSVGKFGEYDKENIYYIGNQEHIELFPSAEFEELSKFPLLPVIIPSNMLIKPDIYNPLLYIDKEHFLIPVLVKLKLRFTNMIFPENVHENLKKCILRYNHVNVINSLEKVLLNTNISMKQLFKDSNLTALEYEKFRIFISEGIDILIGYGKYQENFNNILASLPIWPVYSKKNIFIDAKSGIIHSGITFFSFRDNTNFYNCFFFKDTLRKLGATSINEIDFIKNHILPDLKSSTPSKDYIHFLKYTLSSNNPEIEKCFKQHEAIPNKSLTKFVNVDTLYDTDNTLFQSIFADTDKVLPPELQDNHSCLEALKRIGLKHQVDCDTYIECALEIESQVKQGIFPINVIEYRAKDLVQYLYEQINTLNFNDEQWNKIKGTKFILTEKTNQNQFYQESKETFRFESFENLCSQKYKKICWTQYPLFDENVEPNDIFNVHHPEIGIPFIENIIEHWFVVVTMLKEKKWNNNNKRELKNVINEIYKVMNENSKEENMKVLIKSKINDPNKKLFLNGDDPFDEKNWVTGKDLVFGLIADIGFRKIYKVKDCLKEYRDLLLLAGASEIKTPSISLLSNPTFNSKDKLLNSLLDKLVSQSDDKNFDVIFIIGEEKIGANKCVLSAVSTYFETMFSNGSNKSTENKIEISINDTTPNIFWVILRWLYGQSFEDAAKSVLRKRDEFTTEKESYELTFLIDILKATDFYEVELKDEVEDLIINSKYINFANVCEILELSDKFKATRLKDYCEKYIKLNRQLVIDQLVEFHEDTNERSKMLDLLLAVNE